MGPVGLYIHVPFCVRKCKYCDFVSYPYREEMAADYLKALELEMQHYAGVLSPEHKRFATVYVGGGTPTVLTTAQLDRLLMFTQKYFCRAKDAEVTVEANPGTVDREKLKLLKEMGVNRISFGVQACQQRLLNILGRAHNFKQAVQAVEQARHVGFNNINLDMIFGIPTQRLAEWTVSLNLLLEMQPEHLSCYSLQLEEGTPLAKDVERGVLKGCPDELDLAMYQKAIKYLTRHGYTHYEISNFARPGFQSRHNLIYWHNGNYLGLGPAAHSHFNGERWANTGSLAEYAGSLAKKELPVTERFKLTKKEVMSETVFMGLRLLDGLNLSEFRRRFKQDVLDIWPEQITKLCSQGLLKLTDGRLKLTDKGLPLANIVFMEFV